MSPPVTAPLPTAPPPPPPPPPQDTQQSLTDEQIEQKADEILDVGVRTFVDDYDARMVSFAQELEQLSPDDQARLLEQILATDQGGLHSWVEMDILDRMQNEGRISQEQYAAVASAFAQAYAQGKVSNEQLATFLQCGSLTQQAPALGEKQFNQMLEFLNAGGNTPEMQQLRENFSRHLLSSVVGQENPTFNFHAPGLAMQIAAGSGDPDMAARVFNEVLESHGGTDAVRNELLDAIGQSSIGFRNSQGDALPGLVNPMFTLIDSVARQPNTGQWNDTAVAIARYAETSDDDVFFDMYNDDKPFTDTAEALTGLLASHHGEAILDDLTALTASGTINRDGHAQEFGRNAIQLGNLLRITAFNPDNPSASTAMGTINAWVAERTAVINAGGPDEDIARWELSMMGGAAFDAVQQMKIDQDNREAATQALVGFAVDLVVGALPGGGKISSLLLDDLKESFDNNPAINNIIESVLSPGDDLSSTAISDLKTQIAEAFGEDQADLETLRLSAGSFVQNSILSGLTEDRDIVLGNIQNVQDDIQDNRK